MMASHVLNGVLGGSLIGLSASSLLLGNGDILGLSGIVSSILLKPRLAFSSENQWKVLFLSSFLVTSNVIGRFIHMDYHDSPKLESYGGKYISKIGYIIAGFLVGFGTRLGNGCTSGHGICGLGRGSIRSFAAVFTFLVTALLTSTFMLPMSNEYLLTRTKVEQRIIFARDSSGWQAYILFGYISLVLFLKINSKVNFIDNSMRFLLNNIKSVDRKKLPVAMFTGSLFSAGLALSGMIQQKKIFNFLNMTGIKQGYYDSSLIMVMVGGIIVSAGGYHFVEDFNYFNYGKTLCRPLFVGCEGGKFNIPKNKKIDAKLLIGSALFGVGWGIGGLCPGPALFSAVNGNSLVILFWWPSNILGLHLAELAKQYF